MSSEGSFDEEEALEVVHKCDKLEVAYWEDTLAMLNTWYFADTLGEGQFGKVYLLEDQSQQTKVAVKVVKKAHLPEIENEIRALKKIDSPGVIKFIDKLWSPTYGDVFLVLEYVEGRPVGEVDGKGDLLTDVIPLEELRGVARGMVQAVAAVHDSNVVHLDIKPEHFIRTKTPDGADTIKLIDFGSALTLQGNAADTMFVDDSFDKTVGTPLFLAPEAMTGNLSCPAAALDNWALGVSIYAIGVGYVPFGRGVTSEAALYARVPTEALDFPFDQKEEAKSVSSGSTVVTLQSMSGRRVLPGGPSQGNLGLGLAGLGGGSRPGLNASMSAALLCAGADDEDEMDSASVGARSDEDDDLEGEPDVTVRYMEFLKRILHKTITLRPSIPEMLEDKFIVPDDQGEDNLEVSVRAEPPARPGGSMRNRRVSNARDRNETRLQNLLQNPSLIIHENIGGVYLGDPERPRRVAQKQADTKGSRRASHASSAGSSPTDEVGKPNARKTFIYNTSLARIPASGKRVQRVLLCEFQFHIRNTIEKIIRTAVVPGEVSVDVCRNGEEAVALATKNKYRLIILSTRLVDKPGLQAAGEIREFEKTHFTGVVPIIGLGSAGPKMLEAGLASGCWQAVLTHPLALRDFEQMLRWRGLKTRDVDEILIDLDKQGKKSRGNNKYFSDYVDTVLKRARQMSMSTADLFSSGGRSRSMTPQSVNPVGGMTSSASLLTVGMGRRPNTMVRASDIDALLDTMLQEQRVVVELVEGQGKADTAAMETVTAAGLACIRKMGSAMEAYAVPQDLQRMTSELVRCKRLLSAAEISAADGIQECETLNEALATKDVLLQDSQKRERQLEDERRRWTSERREFDRRQRQMEAVNKELEEALHTAQNATAVSDGSCGLSSMNTSYNTDMDAENQALRGQLDDLRTKYSDVKRELTVARLQLKEAGVKRAREPFDDSLDVSARSTTSDTILKPKAKRNAVGAGLPPRQPAAIREPVDTEDEDMH